MNSMNAIKGNNGLNIDSILDSLILIMSVGGG